MNNIKKIILNSFQEPETHPTIEELFKKVKENTTQIEQDNFKNILKKLEQEGSIYTIISSENITHYGKEKGQHHHIICKSCGKVRDIFLEKGIKSLLKNHVKILSPDFAKIEKVNLSFEGTCYDCVGSNNKNDYSIKTPFELY